MERVPGFNVVAVVMYRLGGKSEGEQAKLEIARDGRMHRVVLQPLSREGFESVDDGKELRTLVPDHKTLLIQDSPLLEASDVNFRLALLFRNYHLQVEGPLKVAGRDALSVLAQPRHEDVLARRLVLDAQTGFMLRLEVATVEGPMETRVEVKSVTFPSSIPSSVFDLRTVKDVRTIRFGKRTEVVSKSTIPTGLTFKPILPHHLPAGFHVQTAQYNSGRFRSVTVRITDGLVKGTVYECSPDDAPDIKLEGATRLTSGTVTFTVVMDAPAKVRDRIAQFFVREQQESLDRHPAPPMVIVHSSAGTAGRVEDVSSKRSSGSASGTHGGGR